MLAGVSCFVFGEVVDGVSVGNIVDGSTYDCPTAGGVELTIFGSGWDFLNVSEASVTVGGSGLHALRL